MRYNHLDMLPEKAFSPVGKRMTLEGGGGGVVGGVGKALGSAAGSLGGAGKVIGPAIQLGTGSSPLGVFGGALGTEIAGNMFGGGGGGNRGAGGPYAPGQPGSSNPYGMGNMYQNQQFQGFGGGNNNYGFGMPYRTGALPGAFSQYQNMPGMNQRGPETAAQEAAERAQRGLAPTVAQQVPTAVHPVNIAGTGGPGAPAPFAYPEESLAQQKLRAAMANDPAQQQLMQLMQNNRFNFSNPPSAAQLAQIEALQRQMMQNPAMVEYQKMANMRAQQQVNPAADYNMPRLTPGMVAPEWLKRLPFDPVKGYDFTNIGQQAQQAGIAGLGVADNRAPYMMY